MIGMLGQASIVALVGMFMGVVPLALSVAYAVAPTERRLALMRPLSLATLFAAISSSVLGLLNVLSGIGIGRMALSSGVPAIGLAEALVPLFVGCGCLAVAWVAIAVGMWRRD